MIMLGYLIYLSIDEARLRIATTQWQLIVLFITDGVFYFD